ncbi:TetR family transcriptional regulator [Jatrophihabitans sp. GAS493]|uniref:TetR/AcrR family transcriptional regulator n=1 Tax=Jatrophihabitans sp. GAS493 TaxID=1907575 RepID=UPI000BB9AAD6|nr:TetR/AcrR family transcriptional regulator [Jatrophihabitans sp. GAS493]SOD71301.1 TetR family transcriptional regulator [Jatrophihabitans sp. GAS493]
MPTKTVGATDTPGSARDRLLAAANELFYEEGVHTVGIDRVIERAGVAKASLYNTFGSKEELIREYLAGRSATLQARITRELAARFDTPREKLIGLFEVQGESFARPGYRGCAFVGATVESRPGGCEEKASADYRGWLRGFITELATDAGAADPAALAQQLVFLYDGASISAWMDHNRDAAAQAGAVATALVDAALPR